MKNLILILNLLFACSISIYAQDDMGDKSVTVEKENIPLEVVISVPNENRSVYELGVSAFLYNQEIRVSFESLFSAVTVTIVSNITGETVYSKDFCTPVSLSIDLAAGYRGEYTINIVTEEIAFKGNFIH